MPLSCAFLLGDGPYPRSCGRPGLGAVAWQSDEGHRPCLRGRRGGRSTWPADRPAARPGAAQDQLAALLTPRRLAGLGVVLALLVVVVLVLARGGGGSRTARPASPPVGTTAASPAAYPATAQRAFLDACVGGTPERRPFCTCSLDQLQHSMPWAEFRQVGQQASNGDTAARQRYAAVVVTCTGQLPRAGA